MRKKKEKGNENSMNLTLNLLSKLLPSPNIFTEYKVASYDDTNSDFKDLNFRCSKTSPGNILNVLKVLNPSKVAGINN